MVFWRPIEQRKRDLPHLSLPARTRRAVLLDASHQQPFPATSQPLQKAKPRYAMPRGTSRTLDAPRASSPPDQSSSPRGDPDTSVPPFFNTTYSIHRVSPLYVGDEGLSPTRLDRLSHRLRDVLVGDVVRGIQIGLEATDTLAGQVGPLRTVHIRWFQASTVLGHEAGPGGLGLASEAGGDPTQRQGLWIEVRHENAGYVAIMMPGQVASSAAKAPGWTLQPNGEKRPAGHRGEGSFLDLPLLLLRMPLPLKNVICNWLSATFDCHIGKVSLGTKTLVSVWEQWLQAVGVPSKEPDVVLSLGFTVPIAESHEDARDGGGSDDASSQPGLKSVDLTILPQDLRRFVLAGHAARSSAGAQTAALWTRDVRERRRLAGPNPDDGWGWRDQEDAVDDPFTRALAQYLDHHMALDLFHPSVHVTQIKCGGFVLTRSRLKIVRIGDLDDDLSRATWMLVTRLGERVRGDTLPSVFG